MTKTIYIKAEKSVELRQQEVLLSDIAKVTGNDSVLVAKARAMRVHRFDAEHHVHCVVSIMKIIEMLQKTEENVEVTVVGTTDTVIEYRPIGNPSRAGEIGKVFFVTMIAFFGTMFTIMAFHNDIGIQQVFDRMYQLIGLEHTPVGALEISYSIGLAGGIILFFNHLGKKNITTDPTPIEVEMRVYEDDVNMTWVQDASRKGEEIDV